MSGQGQRDDGLAVGLGLLLVMSVLLGAFFATHERVEVTAPSGPRGEAAVDPTWALRQALEGLGLPTSARYGLGALPEPPAAVVLLAEGARAREALSPRLLAWVESGGHLIVAPTFGDPGDVLDALLSTDPLPPEAAPAPAPARDTGGAVEKNAVSSDGLPSGEPLSGELLSGDPLSGEPLEPTPPRDTVAEAEPAPSVFPEDPLLAALGVYARFDPTLGDVDVDVPLADPAGGPGAARLRLPASVALTADAWTEPRGPLLPRITRGAGRVDVWPSLEPLKTAQLGQGAAASVLWDQLHDGPAPREVVFILRGDGPSLLSLMWTHGWPAVLSAGALLLLGLWSAGARFGPPEPAPEAPRRSLIEHVDAVGVWMWRHGQAEALLGALRGLALDRHLRLHPEDRGAEGPALHAALARAARVPEAAVAHAWGPGAAADRRALLLAVRTLQQLAADRPLPPAPEAA